MIRVQKDYDSIPESLKPATKDFFPDINDGKYPRKSKTTHDLRKKMVTERQYIENSRYSEEDVRTGLEIIYKGKCAYCEQKVGLDVEHYRPKKQFPPVAGNNPGRYQSHDGYYWLSLSWDNLLLACRDCNIPKSSKFDIQGQRAVMDKRKIKNYRKIHQLRDEYDALEQPLMLNPEKDNPEEHLRFSKDGHVVGITSRGRYTRDVCDLDRHKLVDNRRAIIDEFKYYLSCALDACNGDCLLMDNEVIKFLEGFIKRAQDTTLEYQGFRLQACGWINEVIGDVVSGQQENQNFKKSNNEI